MNFRKMKIHLTCFFSAIFSGLAILWLFLPHPSAQIPGWNVEGIVRAIRVVGASIVPEEEIQKQLIELQPPPLWKFWAKHPTFIDEKLEKGLRQVEQLYREEGYYQARIKPEVVEKNGAVNITLVIYEGPKVILNRIVFNIQVSDPLEWERRFRQIINLQEGDIFQVRNYEKAKTEILEYLANSGYPRAKLTGRVFIYEKENQAAVHLSLELGDFTRFGKIEVQGNKKIATGIIEREITFAEGEPFSMARVFESQARIFGLNFFRSVLLNPVNLSDGTGPVDINVLIQERKRRTVEAGLGYGTEDNLRFRLSGTYRNFLGGARELQLSFRLSSLTEEEALTFKQPYFPDPSSTSFWSLSRKRDEFVSFETINISQELRIEKTFTPIFSAFLSYRLDSSKIGDLDKETQIELEFLQEKVYFLSYFQTGLQWDSSDSRLNPTTGSVTSLYLEPSLKAIGSEISYIKGTIEFKRYIPAVAGTVLAGRILMGTIRPIGLNQRAVPLFKRFFSGGTYSVRGYAYQDLGPKDASGNPIGGNSLAEGNVEFRFPLIGKLMGVTFLDFGNVFLETWHFNFNDLRYSAGLGIRYNTIVGPLRLDGGYLLNPGTTVDQRYRIHLSIGQAF
ncbi:MAG: outer membrane protein assembly factor BamA [bacterium]